MLKEIIDNAKLELVSVPYRSRVPTLGSLLSSVQWNWPLGLHSLHHMNFHRLQRPRWEVTVGSNSKHWYWCFTNSWQSSKNNHITWPAHPHSIRKHLHIANSLQDRYRSKIPMTRTIHISRKKTYIKLIESTYPLWTIWKERLLSTFRPHWHYNAH